MNITIPFWIGYVLVYLVIVALALILLSAICYLALWLIGHRRLGRIIPVWLTCKRYRLRAEKYTCGIISRIIEIMREDRPDEFRALKKSYFTDYKLEVDRAELLEACQLAANSDSNIAGVSDQQLRDTLGDVGASDEVKRGARAVLALRAAIAKATASLEKEGGEK